MSATVTTGAESSVPGPDEVAALNRPHRWVVLSLDTGRVERGERPMPQGSYDPRHRPTARPVPSWFWNVLSVASLGLAATPLLLETTSTAVTTSVEVPSILAVAMLFPTARRLRTKRRHAGTDVATTRRSASSLVSIGTLGSVVVSIVLRTGSVPAATSIVALGAGVVVVAALVRFAAPRSGAG